MKMVPISQEGQTRGYYKYMNVPLEEFKGEKEKELLMKRGNPADVLHFRDRHYLQKKDYAFETEGVYVTDDAGIVVSTCVDCPDITGEMLEWYMVWHQLDPVRYSLWDPEDHYDIKLSEEDQKKLLDKSIPIRERIWDTTSYPLESMNGEEPQVISIPFGRPSDLGYDEKLIGTDSCKAMVCSNGGFDIDDATVPVFMTEVVRNGKDGKTKWIAHWWFGAGLMDGKETVVKIPDEMKEAVAGFAGKLLVHNHKEVTHLNAFLPDLYKDYGKKDLMAY